MDKILEVVKTRKCVGCGNCVSICPVAAIEFRIERGFCYPAVDTEKCVNCGKCDVVCPANGEPIPLFTPSAFFASYAEKSAMHPESTSGGICTLASEMMLKHGDVVYSVRFTDDWNVEYAKLEKLESLGKHVGSKHMQADFNNVQKGISEDLKADRRVLLIGTPCFIGAVKKYLDIRRIDLRNFIAIDFICHGIPSAEVGSTFIRSIESDAGRKLENYNFRSKRFGWGRKERRSTKFAGKPENVIRVNFCPLHTWFGEHLSLRESCFQCDYRRVERPGDITVADFWGIERYYPEIPVEQGVSAVQINTKKGSDFYNALLRDGKVISKTASKESIWEHRRTATQNFEKPSRYNEFWNAWERQGLDGIMRKFPAQTRLGLVIDKLKSILR